MSHKEAKRVRKYVRGAKQLIVDDVLRQLREMPKWQQLKFIWRLLDQSPRIGLSMSPLYAYLEQSGQWGFVLQFKPSWWTLDRSGGDRFRSGWGLTVLGVRIDWRREL